MTPEVTLIQQNLKYKPLTVKNIETGRTVVDPKEIVAELLLAAGFISAEEC